jgi:poly-gamma-glutamate synthesis protein (capsule biosynthesis protein)
MRICGSSKRTISYIKKYAVGIIIASLLFTASSSPVSAANTNDVNIIMVGDILLHSPVEEAAVNESGEYNFDFIFDRTRKDISTADIAIVNQEVIIGGEELGISGYPNFNAPYQIGDALVKTGFDVVCHGTNHALDRGKKGIVNSCNYWKKTHPEITVVGINQTESEYSNINIIKKNDIRIAILNYTYGTNGIKAPSDMPHAVDTLEVSKVKSDLAYAEQNADFTIVCPHWGTEYVLNPDSYQKEWTKRFRKYGADLVIGTHPHVIEPVEMLEDSIAGISNNKGNGDMLVYYSLGNFVNWTSSSGKGIANRCVGGMAQITIGRDKNGEVVIKDHGIKALVCHLQQGPKGVSVYPLSDYTDELGKKNAIIAQDSHFSRLYCIDLCNKVWETAWK